MKKKWEKVSTNNFQMKKKLFFCWNHKIQKPFCCFGLFQQFHFSPLSFCHTDFAYYFKGTTFSTFVDIKRKPKYRRALERSLKKKSILFLLSRAFTLHLNTSLPWQWYSVLRYVREASTENAFTRYNRFRALFSLLN